MYSNSNVKISLSQYKTQSEREREKIFLRKKLILTDLRPYKSNMLFIYVRANHLWDVWLYASWMSNENKSIVDGPISNVKYENLNPFYCAQFTLSKTSDDSKFVLSLSSRWKKINSNSEWARAYKMMRAVVKEKKRKIVTRFPSIRKRYTSMKCIAVRKMY